jgi:hypothetical protein
MKQKLLSLTKKDFKVEFYRASGNGGQNRNKRDTACRITHIETGITAISADERSQLQNKRKAFERLCNHPKFKQWLKIESSRAMGLLKTPEQLEKEVNEWMKGENLKIEYF